MHWDLGGLGRLGNCIKKSDEIMSNDVEQIDDDNHRPPAGIIIIIIITTIRNVTKTVSMPMTR